MTTKTGMSDAGRIYVVTVATVGLAIVLHSLLGLAIGSIGYQWFVLAGLTLLSGSFTIRIPTIPARLSVSETFVFAAAILFGPAAATVIVVLDSLIISLWLRRASRSPSRVLFNMAAPAIAIWTATHAFFAVAGVQPLYLAPRPILSLVAPLLLLALLYFLLNSWLIAGAVGFEKRLSAFSVWRDNFLWLSLNYFSGASVAALLLPYLQDEERAFVRAAGIILPLLLISYLTFKTALGRVDDANRHLEQLNRLYLSTIETLAMAIDAKDQITHGHIRRVQHYAIALASRVGITDSSQIRAIEAASLLHDMGKLAVPEYILNKPGKLTPAEFEKMKLHASVGADILSAIDFPYPVVPIVRHHHENWNGTGYPDGIKGSDIPIGARILSVVDCFDALTSDRPYRPRLSDAEAIQILVERRGSMYDPLIVDTFIDAHVEIAPRETPAPSNQGIAVLARDARLVESTLDGGAGLDNISSSTEEMVALFELARGLSSVTGTDNTAALIWEHLRRVISTSTFVLYAYDVVTDDLRSCYVTGEHSGHFADIRIPRGQRLTGWVAANRHTIQNSDPILDLGEVARELRPRLRTCLSTPLLHEDALIGVISLYSVEREGFSENHRRVIEVIARQVAPTLKRSIDHDAGTTTASRRNAAFGSRAGSDLTLSTPDGDLSIAVVRIAATRASGVGVSEEVVALVAELIRSGLRSGDLLFRHDRAELITLLGGTTSVTAAEITRRVAERIQEQTFGSLGSLKVQIGIATSPVDGINLDSLIAAARLRIQPVDVLTQLPPSIH